MFNNMIRKIFLIAFLGIVNIKSISNISILKHNKNLHCMLNNDTTSAAIAWDYKYKPTFKYLTIKRMQHWTLLAKEQTQFAGVPILDYRWELFKIHTCCRYELPISTNFEMSVSMQGINTLYLCETSKGENCYKVKLNEVGAFHSGNEDHHRCYNFGSLPDDSQWWHFTLSYDNQIFYIKQHGKETRAILKNIYHPKYLAINSKWKIHSFHVFSTNSIGTSQITLKTNVKKDQIMCFGILVYVPMHFKMNVSLENNWNDATSIYGTKGEWKEIQVCGNISQKEVTLTITTSSIYPNNPSGTFYIANIVRQFERPDVRIATLEEDDEAAQHCCYNIKSSDKLCTQHPAVYNPLGNQNCQLSSIGVNCIPCKKIFNQTFCENVLICDSTRSYGVSCSCPSGYRSNGCTEKCAVRYYGFDCKQYCSKCQGSCSHVTGECSSTTCTSGSCAPGFPTLSTTIINETSVLISWKIPDVEVHSTQYHINYWHTNYRACSIEEYAKTFKATLTVNEDSALLTNLLPYSNYTVTIDSLGDNREPQYINISTSEAANLSENEMPQIYTFQNRSELVLSLKVKNCSNVRGSMSYAIEIRCKCEWCQQKDDMFVNITDNLNPTTIFTVLGYTNYTINVRVYRNSFFNDIQTSILTETTAPAKVRNVTIYMVTNTTVGIRWLEPYPPTGVLDKYLVTWNGEQSSQKKVDPEIYSCKVWTEYVCAEINRLDTNWLYVFYIRAKNKNHAIYGAAAKVSATTNDAAPSEPKNVTHFWNESNNALVLRWKHPNIPNGHIVQFNIWKSGKIIKSVDITDENLEYKCELQYDELKTAASSNVTLHISAINDVNRVNFTALRIFTPPKTPKFLENISANDITSTSVKIQIPKLSDIDGESSWLFVTVTDKKIHSDSNFNNEKILAEKLGISEGQNFWIAVNRSLNTSFESGEINFGNEVLENLNVGTTYEIAVLVENQYKDNNRYSVLKLEVTTLGGYNHMLLLLLLFVPVVCIIAFFFYKRYRTKLKSSNDILLTTIPTENVYEEMEEQIQETTNVKAASHLKHRSKSPYCIKILNLEAYVRRCLENKEFEKQYEALPLGQTQDWNLGIKNENKSKNRYKNVAAYDYNRVKLNVVNNDPCSDYINANYIDGYNNRKAYIATQGPKTNTIDDFWRMVWQEGVDHIIMIANLVENGKKKVEKYWPDINETDTYGDVTVTYSQITVLPEYETKVFMVKSGNRERRVTHLHFTCWPDHGVPFYPQSLAPFLKRTLRIYQITAPIVVHCSAGVGRTGTFILSRICLQMAAKTGEVDVYQNLRKLREQRINMVDNINQYKLVHLVLLHLLVAPDYTIECNETMDKAVEEILSSSKISEQMKYISDTFWQDDAMKSVSDQVKDPIIPSKNRFENILPDSYARVTLQLHPVTDETSTYINAVKVDGFCSPSKFIVTQYPLSNTVGDFWRLVDEYEISAMICLNTLNLQDKTCCEFYPSLEGTMRPTAYLEIKCTDVKNRSYNYKVHTIAMNNSHKNETRTVKIIQINEWNSDSPHPKTPSHLLMAYLELYLFGRTSRKILVSCLDGCCASGLFTAMCCLIDKINMEQICDVCLAVRTVRHGRIEFVNDVKQFSFLYKSGLEYVQQFQMYSNFKSGKVV